MPANKPIRRSQLISPFGIGAMVDFPGDESLMTAGLDAWPYSREICPSEWLITEERLQVRLGVKNFRLPPEHRDPGLGVKFANQDIPFIRFPRWHYCHRCGSMEFLSLFGGRHRCKGRPYPDMSCADKPEKRRPFLMPVRVIAICGKGHIQDFPFMEWIHQKDPVGPDCQLRFRAGRSSAMLSGVKIECSCGKNRTLGGVFDFDLEIGGPLHKIGYDCCGNEPWLGKSEMPRNSCGEFLRVAQRGATNVYFPHIISSIYLPQWEENSGRAIIKTLDNPTIWETLTGGLVNGKFIDLTRCKIIADLYKLDAEALKEAAQRKFDGVPKVENASQTEEEHRRQEYDALRNGYGGSNTDLLIEAKNIDDYGNDMSNLFSKICLVKKLRETRVLAGFTRILPPDDALGKERIQKLKIDQSIDWLPATMVKGEGIFIEFNLSKIDEWLSFETVLSRIISLSEQYNSKRNLRGLPSRPISPKFVMMHTFAHILINQLSFDCGYGSASLRERLFCELENVSSPMQGILIYTASGDSEGTMGGLVRQGEPDRFQSTLFKALRRAQWCSSDPVCIESTGQGVDNANLAACHGCVLISETSCEEGNRLLDRGLIVGTLSEPSLGLFANILT